MKVFVVVPNEDWFCDRYANEWIKGNPDIHTSSIVDADVVWVLAGWCWRNVPIHFLQQKKIIVSVHHVDPHKFDKNDFLLRDQFVNEYHVPCEKTKIFIKDYTNKPINIIGYWCNTEAFKMNKEECRKELSLPEKKYLIGSFQRDTEGFDLKTPKLAKGPDIFCDVVEKIQKQRGDVEVVLAGWRRQYVISRLKDANIPFYYFELPPYEVINKLYNSLDLYVVGARYEGGPQALLECAITQTPIVSTDVGMASELLHQDSIFNPQEEYDIITNVEFAYNRIQQFCVPQWFKPYRKMMEKVAK